MKRLALLEPSFLDCTFVTLRFGLCIDLLYEYILRVDLPNFDADATKHSSQNPIKPIVQFLRLLFVYLILVVFTKKLRVCKFLYV